MSDVLHKTRDPVDFRKSVHTPDFPTVDWFINPNISAVLTVPTKHWSRPLTDPVTEMTVAEKAAADAAEAAALVARDRTLAKDLITADLQSNQRILRAIVRLIVDEINILRGIHGLSSRTFTQAKTAIESLVDAN